MELSHRCDRPIVEGPPVSCSPPFFVATADGGRRLRLVGELDVAGVPTLRAVRIDVGGDIEIDCSGLTFIDGSGLRVLEETQQACEAAGVRLRLVARSGCLTKLIDLAGLEGFFDIRECSVS